MWNLLYLQAKQPEHIRLFAETNTKLLVIGADKKHLTEGSHFHGKQFALVKVDIKCQGDLQFYAGKRTLVWVMFWAIKHE